ncbi:Tomoregulin-1 [Acipenser ruthenus]|uniref:Tomoregulin-1 n=1 Tax=Acipenser ruthenus TaxID=7906 RepID=A0A662YQ52_ACIRT|nr:Tomoregulin-1 [Acipenser ruthenus]
MATPEEEVERLVPPKLTDVTAVVAKLPSSVEEELIPFTREEILKEQQNDVQSKLTGPLGTFLYFSLLEIAGTAGECLSMVPDLDGFCSTTLEPVASTSSSLAGIRASNPQTSECHNGKGKGTNCSASSSLAGIRASNPQTSECHNGKGKGTNCSEFSQKESDFRICDETSCKFGGVCKEEGGDVKCACQFQCHKNYIPVCGSNGDTYQNECYLRQASCKHQKHISVLSEGPCYPEYEGSGSDVNRKFTKCGTCKYGAECDEDSEDVWCICNIDCSGHNENPVCATDGDSYKNPCLVREASCLKQEQIDVKHLGKCPVHLSESCMCLIFTTRFRPRPTTTGPNPNPQPDATPSSYLRPNLNPQPDATPSFYAQPDLNPQPTATPSSYPRPNLNPQPDATPPSYAQPDLNPQPTATPSSYPRPNLNPQPTATPSSYPRPNLNPQPTATPSSYPRPNLNPQPTATPPSYSQVFVLYLLSASTDSHIHTQISLPFSTD